MPLEPQNDPANRSADYKANDEAWCMIDDIMAGVDQVKKQRTKYLPQHTKEDDGVYANRLKSAPWRPEFEDAIRSLAAKPFTKQLKLSEDAPDVFIGEVVDETTKERKGGLVDDIDGEGNSLHVFAKDVMLIGIAFGLDAIYVTFPNAAPARNKAEEKQMGLRPYWVHVRAKDIIDLKVIKIDGKLTVSSIRMIENSWEQNGFSEVLRERIRYVFLENGKPKWRMYLKNKDGEYVVEGSDGEFEGMTRIPIVLFFTNERKSHYVVKPPLYDLAHVQLELYRSMSRQDQILTLAGSPMLKFTGFAPPKATVQMDKNGVPVNETPQPVVAVGPGITIYCPAGATGVQPDADYIQPSAANIKEVREGVDAIMKDFRRLAMQPTTPESGSMVATGLAIDAARAHSALEAWALLLKDAIDQAIGLTSEWLKIQDTVTCHLHTDFAVTMAGDEGMTRLQDAAKRNVISPETERHELARRNILGPDFDEEKEAERVAKHVEGLEPEEPIDPITGKPIQPIDPLTGKPRVAKIAA
jgi:hypothetical protein